MAKTKLTSFLKDLRSVMKNISYVSHPLQAYIVPHDDAHASEYLANCDQRIAFISGFTGSRGTAVVTHTQAALWTDGRYFLQANQELGPDWILMKDGLHDTVSVENWLIMALPSGSYIGVDPMLIPYYEYKKIAHACLQFNLNLIPVEKNLIDVIWTNKPTIPKSPIFNLPLEFAGESWQRKIEKIRHDMNSKRASVLVLTALDDVAWLFNLRGSDISYNPLFFAYSVITLNDIHLFLDKKKLNKGAEESLVSSNGLKIEMHNYEDIYGFIKELAQEQKKVWIHEKSSYGLVSLIPKPNRIMDMTPVIIQKTIKNKQEIENMRNAHIKDAVALCEFFSWLEENIKTNSITELSAVSKLEEFRKTQKHYMGPSFNTISCAGPNSAIIHYNPESSPDKEVIVTSSQIYLNDSGGQYLDGTTDVTRTWHFGTPSDYQKECFTRVFQGVVALTTATFPPNIKGSQLHAIARKSLWDAGLDYLHGTSHGVGMFLCVHEGPIGIYYAPKVDEHGFKEGIVASIEPGYYEDGEFGIRIENLAVTVVADTKYHFRKEHFLTFETLTLVPIQTKLLDPSLLTANEIKWLNDYHVKCREVVGSILKAEGKKSALRWLMKQTEPIG